MEEAIVRLFGWIGSGHRNPHWCFGPTVIGMNLRLNAKFDPASTSWISSSRDTVDGLEIRRSPVEVGSLSHYLQGFIHPRW